MKSGDGFSDITGKSRIGFTAEQRRRLRHLIREFAKLVDQSTKTVDCGQADNA